MILSIFILLLCISAFLIWFGYYSTLRYLSIVGFIFLFLLGAWVILYSTTGQGVGLLYPVGENITTLGNTSISTDVYATYNDATTFWVGFLISIVSLLGAIFSGFGEGRS